MVVQNERIDVVVNLYNPWAIALELQSVALRYLLHNLLDSHQVDDTPAQRVYLLTARVLQL